MVLGRPLPLGEGAAPFFVYARYRGHSFPQGDGKRKADGIFINRRQPSLRPDAGTARGFRASQIRMVFRGCGMPESEVPMIEILLVSCAGLLFLIFLLVFRISRRLTRIEGLVGQSQNRHEMTESAPSAAERSPGGAFETFLNEDPARRHLPKGEQFSAYRQWRHENGMNWSNS